MSIQHQSFVSLALRLIERNGRPVILSVPESTGPAYDPKITYRRFGVMAVNDKFKIEEKGDLVQSTDKMFLIGNTVPVTADMRLSDYDQSVHSRIPMGEIRGADSLDECLIADYSIGHLNPVQPGSTTVYYEVYARV